MHIEEDNVIVCAKTKTVMGNVGGSLVIFGGYDDMFKIPITKLFTNDQRRKLRWTKRNKGIVAQKREYNRLRRTVIADYNKLNPK